MPHVLIAGKIHDDGIDVLRRAPGVTFDYVEEVSVASYAPLIGAADGLLIRTQPLRAELIAQAPRLRIVARHGVGYDSVDVEALSARRIPLAIVGDVNSRCVAEHTLMLMLAVARRLVHYDRSIRTGGWEERNALDTAELWGKTVLIIGFGRVGRHVAALARAFGMQVLAADPYLPADAVAAEGARPVADLGAGLRQADFVTLHAPKSEAWPVIGEAELSAMKPSAVVINTARGGGVDEAALARALAEGRIGGAALDVFGDEPPAPDHPLFRSDRVVLSPHAAGLTRECAARMGTAAAQNILAAFDDRLDPALVVNADRIGLTAAAGAPRRTAFA